MKNYFKGIDNDIRMKYYLNDAKIIVLKIYSKNINLPNKNLLSSIRIEPKIIKNIFFKDFENLIEDRI